MCENPAGTDVVCVRCQQQNELRLQSSLTDASLAWLAPLKHLRTLGLRSCVMVEGGGLRHITALSMLRSLDLTGCVRLTNKGAAMPAVDMRDHVCIWALSGSEQGTKLSAQTPAHGFISCTQSLHMGFLCGQWHLGLYAVCFDCDISARCPAGLDHVVALTALTALNLRECRLITNDGLRRLEPLVQLKTFSMSNCTSVTDKGLQSLAKLTGGRGHCLGWGNCSA